MAVAAQTSVAVRVLLVVVAAGSKRDVVMMTVDVLVGGCGSSEVTTFRDVYWTVDG